MGYNISTIQHLPCLSGYYFFLLGKKEYTYGRSGNALFHKFDELAERINTNSAIVMSHKSSILSDELVDCISRKPWFHEMYVALLHAEPALVVTNSHPREFDFKDNEIFAVISFKALDEIYPNEADLINDIVNLSIKGDTTLLKKAQELQNGVGLLERIKNSLILQPNFYGLGLDLRKVQKKTNKETFVQGL